MLVHLLRLYLIVEGRLSEEREFAYDQAKTSRFDLDGFYLWRDCRRDGDLCCDSGLEQGQGLPISRS